MMLPARARLEKEAPRTTIAAPLPTSHIRAAARIGASGSATIDITSAPKLRPSSPSPPIFRALEADSLRIAEATNRSASANNIQMMPMSTSVITSTRSGQSSPQAARVMSPMPRIQSVCGIDRHASCRVNGRMRIPPSSSKPNVAAASP